MDMSETFSYRMPSGSVYKIQFCRILDASMGPDFFRMKIIEHPPCSYPLGVQAHLDADFISVGMGREPQTIERAKAIACRWMTGFETYHQSGEFPDGRSRFDVKEV